MIEGKWGIEREPIDPCLRRRNPVANRSDNIRNEIYFTEDMLERDIFKIRSNGDNVLIRDFRRQGM